MELNSCDHRPAIPAPKATKINPAEAEARTNLHQRRDFLERPHNRLHVAAKRQPQHDQLGITDERACLERDEPASGTDRARLRYRLFPPGNALIGSKFKVPGSKF